MNTNEQKLTEARKIFEEAAGYGSDNHAVNLLGEGFALLTDALVEMSRDIERIKTASAKRPK